MHVSVGGGWSGRFRVGASVQRVQFLGRFQFGLVPHLASVVLPLLVFFGQYDEVDNYVLYRAKFNGEGEK